MIAHQCYLMLVSCCINILNCMFKYGGGFVTHFIHIPLQEYSMLCIMQCIKTTQLLMLIGYFLNKVEMLNWD